MPGFANGAFTLQKPNAICNKKDKHIWLYETPSFRYCKECGLTQHYAYTLYSWEKLETENAI